MSTTSDSDKVVGTCGLCGRVMIDGKSINKHHLVPKSMGGREVAWIHVVCHGKIHQVFTLQELRDFYHTFERLRDHPAIQKYVRWVKRKDPQFKTRHLKPRGRRR